MVKSKLVQGRAVKNNAEQAFQTRYDAAINSINGVFGGYKRSGDETFLLLANFAEHYQYVDIAALKKAGFEGVFTDLLHGRKLDLDTGAIYLNPYEFFWLKQ